MPTSGGEKPFEPEKWNDAKNGGKVQKTANCTPYSADKKVNPITGKPFRGQNDTGGLSFWQPGDLSGKYNRANENENIINIVELMKADLELPNVNMTIRSIGKWDRPSKKGYKVALFIFPSKNNYHWMRQNPDGSWSHKNNVQEVTTFDGRGNVIYDPEQTEYNDKSQGWYFKGYYEFVEN